MEKEKLLRDIMALMIDIDNCTETILYNKQKGNELGLHLAHDDMESLMASARQELSMLYNYIKEGVEA